MGIKEKVGGNYWNKLSVDLRFRAFYSWGVLALIIATLKSNKLFVENTTLYNKILTWIEDINSNPVRLSIFSDFTVVNLDDDFIGAFYQSIQGISAKSKIGSYYTPAELLTTIRADKNKSVIDPCCGSGGVLLKYSVRITIQVLFMQGILT